MKAKSASSVLIFGASGAIGSALCTLFQVRGWNVIAVTRSGHSKQAGESIRWLSWDVGRPDRVFDELEPSILDAAVWAQGMNFNDDVRSFDSARHREMYSANVVYIIESLHALLGRRLLAAGSRLCIVSSIWQNLARQNKLSYCVTKSAIEGLVRSLSIDLGAENILVNAVLPGALDTPMTHANLTAAQIESLRGATPLGSLPSLEDVCGLVGFLCSPDNSGVTGQFVAADRGFSHVRII
jgi:3-oxoacyl-[acyl-carrier protein] reductase